jgi:hypothetical protein
VPRTQRPAFTLAELVVAITVGGIAFGAFAVVVALQERAQAFLDHRIRARAQAIEGIAVLVSDLRSLSPPGGDLPAGEARDSAIELRATVGLLVACEVRDRTVVGALASFISSPRPGDSAWAYVSDDSGSAWVPLAVGDVRDQAASDSTACSLPATAAAASRSRGDRRFLLELARPPSVRLTDAIVRVTRRTRYSLYRAPDKRWYLGRREFNTITGAFETIQPVSGPFRPYAPAVERASGLELRYYDTTGAEVVSGSAETHRIAKVDVTLRTPTPAEDPSLPQRRDVTSITVGLRNLR